MKHFLQIASLAVLAAISLSWPTRAVNATPAPADEHKRAGAFTTSMAAKSDAVPADRETMPGAPLYHARCSMCHEGQVPKAPIKTFVQFMAPDMIYAALTHGIMQKQATGLSDRQRQDIAEYLSGERLGTPAAPAAPACTGSAARFDLASPPRLRGWGFNDHNTHFIPAEIAGLSATDIPHLQLKWAFAYPGAMRARSRPTFAFGALYVGSQNGTVYALDAASGCVRWSYRVQAEVRTPIVISADGNGSAARPLAFFGDITGHVYAVDAQTGSLKWQLRADDHPSATITGSPVYHDGILYVPVSSLEETMIDPTYECCTFRGSILAIDAATGQRRWKSYTIDNAPAPTGKTKSGGRIFSPSGAPIWNSPTLDTGRGRLYVGTGNNYSEPANDRSSAIVAFDLASGAYRWSWQAVPRDAWNVGCMLGNDTCPKEQGPDYDLGSGTLLDRGPDGHDRIFAGLKSGAVLALDPDRPQSALWRTQLGRGSIQGGIQFGMASDGRRLYVPVSDMRDSHDGKVYTQPPAPGLYALDPVTGKTLWHSAPDDICAGRPFCDPGILASIAVMPGVVFAGHQDGRVRAYDSASGKVLWQFDSSQDLATVSGAHAHGGTIGAGGPVAYNGMLYVNSGYGLYFHMPGNVLLAFTPAKPDTARSAEHKGAAP